MFRAWHISDNKYKHYIKRDNFLVKETVIWYQELEATPLVILGHWLVCMIDATLNNLLYQYLATTNYNVENVV